MKLSTSRIAADGLTRPSVHRAENRLLHPGYRSDVLVTFREPGTYCVIDAGLVEANEQEPDKANRRLLFTVNVKSGSTYDTPVDPEETIAKLLTRAAQAASPDDLPAGLKSKITADLQAGLKLESFSPHASLEDALISNYQHVRFALGGAVQTDDVTVPAGLGIGHVRVPAPANPASPPPFGDLRFSTNPGDTINLYLGDVDEWRLTVREPVGHPFHIHVNPFEVREVLRRSDGTDLTLDPASQYFGMKGVFKDTIFVEPGAEVVVRSHYERYIGKFVLHCHILYHEDMGMMRLVQINDPVRPGAQTLTEAHH